LSWSALVSDSRLWMMLAMPNTEKMLPRDLDSEEAVIGSLLIDGAAINKIIGYLAHGHFYYATCQLMYKACQELYARSESIDQITLAQELVRMGNLETCGGVANLSRLISICPTALDIENYANIVYQLYLSRELIRAGEHIKELGFESRPDFSSAMSEAEQALFSIQSQKSDQDLVHIREILDAYLEPPPAPEETESMPYVDIGFRDVDKILGGISRSDLVLLAGRPGAGKTSLALNVARNVASSRRGCVAIFSLEMSREELVMRMLASESGVDLRRFDFYHQDNDRTEDEERRLMHAVGALSECPIYIDDSAALRVAEVRGKIRRLQRITPIDLVVIDHIGLMQSDSRHENRVNEIGYISRSLKGIAKSLKIPVLALSQLSRATEHREDPRPKLPDLRESGDLEQNADTVLFIFRESYYYTPDQWRIENPNRPYPADEADLIIGKHRSGPQGEVKLRFNRNLTKFSDFNLNPSPQSNTRMV